MHPQLQPLLGQLESATARASALAASVDDAAFRARPANGGWSAAECIAHLNLTTLAFLPRLDAALATARSGFGDDRRYRSGVVGALLAWSLDPSRIRFRFRTSAGFVPEITGAGDDVAGEFERLQRELAARIERASGLHLNELRIASPFDARASYNPYAAFRILLAHERRHLRQAERAAGFESA